MIYRTSGRVTRKKKRKFLLQRELQTLLSYVQSQANIARKRGTKRAIIDELIILLLTQAGLRASEIRMLKIKDLPTIHGEETLWIQNAMGEILRKVNISEDFAQRLTKFVRLYRKRASQKEPLMKTERGSSFGYMNLYSKVRRIGERAGIGQLTPAILQHSYMVHLYKTEQDLRYVQEQTGYASRRTLTKYLMEGHRNKTSMKRGRAGLMGQEPTKQKSRHLESRRTCEGCGEMSLIHRGRIIESGQFLCQKCLDYFRSG